MIKQYNSNIQYSTNNGFNWINIVFPCTFKNNGNHCTILFITDLKGYTGNYFIIGSNNITINGQGHIFTVDSSINYDGLIQNGRLNIKGFTNITLENIGVNIVNNCILNFNAGWLCQSYFGNGIKIITKINNCYSTGQITQKSGGIFGRYSGSYNGSIQVNNCYSTGSMDFESGGIFGSYAGSYNGTIKVANCYSTGSMDFDSGGIFGSYAGLNNGSIIASNCYWNGTKDNSGISIDKISNYYAYFPLWDQLTAIKQLNNTQKTWITNFIPWPLSSFNANIYNPIIININNGTGISNAGLFQSNFIYKFNGFNNPNITINPSSGEITFTNLPNGSTSIPIFVHKNINNNLCQYNFNSLIVKNTNISYKLTYNSNGSSSGKVPLSQKSLYNTNIEIKNNIGNLEKKGFSFSEWNTDTNSLGMTYLPNSIYTIPAYNSNLYAIYTINSYTLTYNSNGSSSGSVPSSQTALYNTDIQIQNNIGNLVKNEYSFSNWNTDSNGLGTTYFAGSNYKISSFNNILYAIYNKINWTKIFIPLKEKKTYTIWYKYANQNINIYNLIAIKYNLPRLK